MALTNEEVEKAVDDLRTAFGKFRLDLGFTSPELYEMRIDNLERRVESLIEDLGPARP